MNKIGKIREIGWNKEDHKERKSPSHIHDRKGKADDV